MQTNILLVFRVLAKFAEVIDNANIADQIAAPLSLI